NGSPSGSTRSAGTRERKKRTRPGPGGSREPTTPTRPPHARPPCSAQPGGPAARRRPHRRRAGRPLPRRPGRGGVRRPRPPARALELLAARLARRGVGLPAAALVGVLSARPLAASVPPTLAASTSRVAGLMLGGSPVPAGLAALAHQVTRSMFPRRLHLAAG